VIATLVYLSTQIRQNTRSMDEGHRLAKAQSYENRSSVMLNSHIELRGSPYIEILTGAEGPDDLETREDTMRFTVHMRWWANYCDNMHYQFEQGYLDADYYSHMMGATIERFAPIWRSMGIAELRPSFRAEVDRILRERSDASDA
jgi:hypothetical protein